MKAIDPHIHMVSRTTDDYLTLAISGIHTVSEPAFWAGFDRGSADSFRDYFYHLTVTEPARAARFGIRHFCWIGLNSKEAENLKLAEEVLAIMPEFLDASTAIGIGEVGLNKNSRNEIKVFEKHLEMAVERNELLLIHTPHLEDKLKGTRIIMDIFIGLFLTHAESGYRFAAIYSLLRIINNTFFHQFHDRLLRQNHIPRNIQLIGEIVAPRF